MIPELSWAYLSGFIDGDGWITKSRNKNGATDRYTVGITQKATSWEFMDKICEFLTKNSIHTERTR